MNIPTLGQKKTIAKYSKINFIIKETIVSFIKRKVFEEDIISKSLITIMKINISKDYKSIVVMFTTQEHMKKRLKEIEMSLKKISNNIRYILFKKINLRFSPTLKFQYDHSFDKSKKINNLINNIYSEKT